MKQILPILLLMSFPLITVVLWLAGKNSLASIVVGPLTSASQILALLGFALMSVSFVLITKNKYLESLFGGLDKMYSYHQSIGAIAFVLILNHPILLAVNSLPFFKISINYLLPSQNIPYDLGIASIIILVLSFSFIYLIKLPYHVWLMTHRFLGLAFLLGGFHSIFVGSDIAQNPILKIWFIFLFALGTGSFVLKIFFHKHTSKKYHYLVERVERTLDIFNIYLRPVGTKIPFTAGQFGFVTFYSRAISKESHPFSFSSSPHENILRVSAKMLGDYTLSLPNLTVGDRAEVSGPHGNFVDDPSKPQIWVAGGIGITPLLSLIKERILTQKANTVSLYYCVSKADEAVYCNELNQDATLLPHFRWKLWESKSSGRISAEKIFSESTLDPDTQILLCGPVEMMEKLTEQFIRLGVPDNNIIFENFKFI